MSPQKATVPSAPWEACRGMLMRCTRGAAGEQLTSGWTPVLRLLEAVPGGQGASTVGLGFQSVQLLASDYMSSLPPPLMRSCLTVATLYASQQADMNVSLTAISLLWNAADLLSKLSSSSAASNGGALPPVVLEGAHLEELLRVLFFAMQVRCGLQGVKSYQLLLGDAVHHPIARHSDIETASIINSTHYSRAFTCT